MAEREITKNYKILLLLTPAQGNHSFSLAFIQRTAVT
jgi:hypothetical protein